MDLREFHQIIADRIYTLCGVRGISINKLATMSGIKQTTIDNIIHENQKSDHSNTAQNFLCIWNDFIRVS